MRTVRALVADPSPTFRRLVATALERLPDVRVAASVRDGSAALERIAAEPFDLVVLDLDLAAVDGAATIREIRRRDRRVPVVVVSGQCQPDAPATREALAAGATRCVAKPPTADDRFLDELGEVVRGALEAPRQALAGLPPAGAAPRRPFGPSSPRLVVVGASTGGPEAIAQLLGAVRHPLRVPVLLVQHMPPFFTPVFAQRLASATGADVREAIDGEVLLPGRIRVAPGDRHVVVRAERGGLRTFLNTDPPENSCRPAVDVTLRSAAEACDGRVLTVILTGVGADGRAGCAALRARGGTVLAQDEATSVVWGMPGAVTRAGLASRVGPIPELAFALEACLAVAGAA